MEEGGRMRKAAMLVKASAGAVQDRILNIRGEKVILDSDLAALYGVTTKILNQAVKRNAEKFPVDFMFQLAPHEVDNLRSQIVTSSSVHGGRRYLPFAFTEHGAIMAATVLKSPRAVQMSVRPICPPTTLRRGRQSLLPRRARWRGPPKSGQNHRTADLFSYA